MRLRLFSTTADNLVVPFFQTLRSSRGVSSARGAEESLRDGPSDAQSIPISTGRPGSGVPLAEETTDAQHVPHRAQRPKNQASDKAKRSAPLLRRARSALNSLAFRLEASAPHQGIRSDLTSLHARLIKGVDIVELPHQGHS